MSQENLQEKLIGFAKLDKAVIVHTTVVQFSPKVFDFLSRHTDRSGLKWTAWQSTKVSFDILINSRDKTEFVDDKNSSNKRSRLYLPSGAMGKRIVIEDALTDDDVNKFTAQHRADLEVALKELADAVRAEKQTLDADLQAF